MIKVLILFCSFVKFFLNWNNDLVFCWFMVIKDWEDMGCSIAINCVFIFGCKGGGV